MQNVGGKSLKKTAWKGIRQDKAFKESLILAKKMVVEDALAEFKRRVTSDTETS